MYRTDSPLDDFDRYEREKERLEALLPKCDICGRTIDDHYYNIYGEIMCEICLDENFRLMVEI